MTLPAIPFDVSGSTAAQTDAIVQAMLTGRPLSISESARPDLPAVAFSLGLDRAPDAAPTPPAAPERRTRTVAVDGRDALFFLVVHPGPGGTADGGPSVLVEHGGSGLSRGQAAHILRKFADRLDAAEQAEADTAFPPRGGHGELCAYAAGIGRTCTCTPD